MERAFLALRTGSPGPVLLELPIDVTEEKFSGSLDYRPVQSVKAGGDPFAIQESVKLLLAITVSRAWPGRRSTVSTWAVLKSIYASGTSKRSKFWRCARRIVPVIY